MGGRRAAPPRLAPRPFGFIIRGWREGPTRHVNTLWARPPLGGRMSKKSRGRGGRSPERGAVRPAGGSKFSALELVLLAAILLATFLAYRSTLNFGFLTSWDDHKYILMNDRIRSVAPASVWVLFTEPYFSNYHPLTMLSYAVQYRISGTDPGPYHAANLFLHLVNTVLLFAFMRLLAGRAGIAAIVAGVFALHPMHVESVAWVSERKDLLYALFFFAALAAYVLYIKRGYRTRFLVLTFVLFLLSLLSKSAAAALPLVLLLVDYHFSRSLTDRRVLLEKAPFFLLSAVFGAVALASQGAGGATGMAPHFPAYDRLFLSCYAALFYILKFVFPLDLCAMYYYPDPAKALPFIYYLAPLALALAAWGIARSGKHRRHLVWGALFYLSTAVMVLQLVPLGRAIAADRYSYVPFVGLSYIAAHFYCLLAERGGALRYGLLAVALVLAALMAAATSGRCKVWKDGLSLYDDVVKKNPRHYHGWAGRAFSKMEAKDYAGADLDYTEAVRLHGGDTDILNNRGNCLYKLGKYREAIADFDRCIGLDPKFSQAYYNKGLTLERLGRDYASAEALYTRAVQLDPEYASAYGSRGFVRFNLKDYAGALADCDRAIQLKPDFVSAYQTRGSAKVGLGRFEEAITDFDRAIELAPDFALAYSNRGVARFRMGDAGGACADWQVAARKGSSEAARLFGERCGKGPPGSARAQ